MDPQKVSQLDPKLRDAYQRVMGTVIPEPQAPVQEQTPPPPPAPIPEPTPNPVPVPQPIPQPEPIPTPVIEPVPAVQEPPPAPIVPPVQTLQPQNSNFVQMNSEVASAVPTAGSLNFATPTQAQAIVVKKKGGILMPLLIGIAVLVFIAIYTLFWTKIFNFKLPFLP